MRCAAYTDPLTHRFVFIALERVCRDGDELLPSRYQTAGSRRDAGLAELSQRLGLEELTSTAADSHPPITISVAGSSRTRQRSCSADQLVLSERHTTTF
jgi:hypothetical protein